MRLPLSLLLIVVAAGCVATPRDAVSERAIARKCIQFERPLGYSFSGTREKGDLRWYVLQLGDSGTVTRPLFPQKDREWLKRNSRWSIKGDTLLVRVSDGLVGWDVALRRTRPGYSGVATYLTDVIVDGRIPRQQLDVRAALVPCPGSSPQSPRVVVESNPPERAVAPEGVANVLRSSILPAA